MCPLKVRSFFSPFISLHLCKLHVTFPEEKDEKKRRKNSIRLEGSHSSNMPL